MRRALVAATLALWALAAQAAAQPATIGEVLACETDANQPACLLRVGARDWNGDSDQAVAAMTAIVHFQLDDASLGLGPDEQRTFATVRALAEAARRDSAGQRPSRVIAPIARLAREDRAEAYRLFAYGPHSFVFPMDVWRPRAVREDTVRVILRALEEDENGLSNGELRSLASGYASRGMEAEGRALLRRHRGEEGATAFWYAVGDFDAAERSMRADGDVNPMMLIYVAAAAAEAGDHARSARLATELLETYVRGRGARVIVAYDSTALAETAARILAASGQADQTRAYALALMDGQAPGGALFGSHAQYAITMLTAIGDLGGACVVARTLAAAIETPVAGDADIDAADERATRAEDAAVALARCGDSDAARAIAARYGVEDFWLSFYLGDAFAGMSPPDVGGLAGAIEDDLTAGRNERAMQLMQILFVQNPTYATGVMHGGAAWNAAAVQAWRGGTAFAALRAALLRDNRSTDQALTPENREYVFAAALMLAVEP